METPDEAVNPRRAESGAAVRSRARVALAWHLAAALWIGAGPARADQAREAFEQVRVSDALFAAGRVGQAYSGYLEVLRRYPTWFLPALKAAVVAQALGLPAGTVQAYLDRAEGSGASGPFFRLVRSLWNPERAVLPEKMDAAALEPTAPAVRAAMARAKGFERSEPDSAIREYRWITARCDRCVAAFWRLARLLRAAARFEEAREVLEQGARRSLYPARWK